MLLLSSEQSRELDRLAIHGLGIAEAALMECAGLSVVLAMEKEWERLSGLNVAVLCGKGRNGADGMVAARHLVNQGSKVVVCVSGSEAELNPAARAQARILQGVGIQMVFVSGDGELALARSLFQNADLVVDALYGSGFKGAVIGLPALLLLAMNASGRPVVSVDLPSGVDTDTGAVRGAAASAALTVTFTLPKRGLALMPGRGYTGKLLVADIGVPVALASRLRAETELCEASDARSLLPRRLPTAHKKSAGTLLMVVGSREYAGAAILAARAALASGAGFVRLLVPDMLVAQIQSAVPEAVVAPRPDPAGILALARECHAVVVGPGLGRDAKTLAMVRDLYEKLPIPAVVDADALYALGASTALRAGGPRLLTPHDGEMAGLLGAGHALLEADRLGTVRAFADQAGVALLLKGPATLVAAPERSISVNATGSPALATAGTGDVLSGLCGTLLAQGLGAYEAGRLGAYLHGYAADLWNLEHGETGLTAGFLVETLPLAFSKTRG